MQVTIQGTPLSINWKHNNVGKHRSTECYIKIGTGKDAPLLIQAKSNVFHKDTFNRSIGRKKSLSQALKAIANKEVLAPFELKKEDKLNIWVAYAKMTSMLNTKPHYAKTNIKNVKKKGVFAVLAGGVRQLTLPLSVASKTPIVQISKD